MRTTLLATLLLSSATMARADEVRFVMAQGARAFAATLGSQCLTDDRASIVADGNIVTVRDSKACAAEIRTVAENWLIFSNDSIVTLQGTPEALTMVRERLEARFGKSPSQSLRFLAPTQHCRCLAFVGRKQEQAATVAQGLLPHEAKDKGRGVLRDPLAGPLFADPSTDLIQDATPGSVSGGDGPLVN